MNEKISYYESLKYKLLDYIYLLLLIFGIIYHIPEIIINKYIFSYQNIIIDGLTIAWLSINLFKKKLFNYSVRSISLIVVVLIYTTQHIFNTNVNMVSVIWLLSVPLFSSVLTNKKTTKIITVINFVLFSFIIFYYPISNIGNEIYYKWFLISNYIIITFLLTYVVNKVIGFLEDYSENIKEQNKIISNEKIKLEQINIDLKNEIDKNIKIKNELLNKNHQLLDAQNIANFANFIYDRNNKQLIISENLYNILNYSKQEVKSDLELYNLFKKRAVDINYFTMIKNVLLFKEITYEVSINRINEKNPIWIKLHLIYDPKNHIIRGILQDITKEKIIFNSIYNNELKYRTLYENANDAIFILRDTIFHDANAKTLELFECSLEYIKGKTPADISPEYQENGELSSEKAIKFIQKAKREGKANFDWIHRSKSGKLMSFSITLTLISIHDTEYIYAILKDVTDRKLWEDKLKKSERRLKAALDASRDAIFEWNFKNDDSYFSKRFYEMLGIKKHKNNISYKSMFGYLHPDDFEKTNKFLENIYNSNSSYFELEARYKRKDNLYIWLLIRGLILSRDENNHPINIVGTFADITERKSLINRLSNINNTLEDRVESRTNELKETLSKLENEIKRRKETENELLLSYKQLEFSLEKEKEISNIKSRFISMVSHEYRTPLTVILSSSEILSILYEMHNKDEFDKNIKKIQNSVKEMTKLLEEVLIIGKNENEKISINPVKFNLYELLLDIIDDINIDLKKISINNTSKEIYIQSDYIIIKYVINNIITNAIKYSKNEIKIDINIYESDKKVIINIKDYGIGISKEDLSQIFEPFYRGENIEAKSGSGLGLAIVKKYLEIINGNIIVESEINQGTNVKIEIPKYL